MDSFDAKIWRLFLVVMVGFAVLMVALMAIALITLLIGEVPWPRLMAVTATVGILLYVLVKMALIGGHGGPPPDKSEQEDDGVK